MALHCKCRANAWQMHSKIPGLCMANARQMHGNCMATAWQMHGNCMASMANAWHTAGLHFLRFAESHEVPHGRCRSVSQGLTTHIIRSVESHEFPHDRCRSVSQGLTTHFLLSRRLLRGGRKGVQSVWACWRPNSLENIRNAVADFMIFRADDRLRAWARKMRI